MKIAVLIKQVPETRSVRMDEKTGTVVRQGNESIINPIDLYAINAALKMKEMAKDAQTVVFTMGPPAAEKVLKEAIALGLDGGVLISDRAYAGSDTWATSKILQAAIEHSGNFDLILCGERATDGDTGQVGPELASAMNYGVVTFVEALSYSNGTLKVSRQNEHGVEHIEVTLPAVLCVTKGIGELGLPTLAGVKAARRRTIPMLSQKELNLSPGEIGLPGSPTRVVKIFRPVLTRKCEKIVANDPASMGKAVKILQEALTGGAL